MTQELLSLETKLKLALQANRKNQVNLQKSIESNPSGLAKLNKQFQVLLSRGDTSSIRAQKRNLHLKIATLSNQPAKSKAEIIKLSKDATILENEIKIVNADKVKFFDESRIETGQLNDAIRNLETTASEQRDNTAKGGSGKSSINMILLIGALILGAMIL